MGTAGSANLGDRYAMFEAIHGSAPRLIEEGLAAYANPASILKAAAMLLRHICRAEAAQKLENALDSCDLVVDILSGIDVLSAETGQILYNDTIHDAGADVIHHALKVGTVIVCPCISIVFSNRHKFYISIVLKEVQNQLFLIGNTVTLRPQTAGAIHVLFGQPHIRGCKILSWVGIFHKLTPCDGLSVRTAIHFEGEHDYLVREQYSIECSNNLPFSMISIYYSCIVSKMSSKFC